jgi:GDPmannose 4,6-dehydratase
MKPSPRAVLIFGISGQVGAYLAKHLIEQGYTVHGTSRDSDANPFTNLRRVGVPQRRHGSFRDAGGTFAACSR